MSRFSKAWADQSSQHEGRLLPGATEPVLERTKDFAGGREQQKSVPWCASLIILKDKGYCTYNHIS